MAQNKKPQRISFASIKSQIEYPDFLDIQLQSFQDFFQLETTSENRQNEGLYKVFAENFPISDARNNFVLEFLDYFIDPLNVLLYLNYIVHQVFSLVKAAMLTVQNYILLVLSRSKDHGLNLLPISTA